MDYSGMTVNERLYASKQMQKFEDAIKARDVRKVISILEKLEVDKESIKLIIKNSNLS